MRLAYYHTAQKPCAAFALSAESVLHLGLCFYRQGELKSCYNLVYPQAVWTLWVQVPGGAQLLSLQGHKGAGEDAALAAAVPAGPGHLGAGAHAWHPDLNSQGLHSLQSSHLQRFYKQ